MSNYDDLVERCSAAAYSKWFNGTSWEGARKDNDYQDCWRKEIMAVLAEVARTLETVTPEMEMAWENEPDFRGKIPLFRREWLAMLRASPLFPPDKEPPR